MIGLGADGAAETPMEKFHRLKGEVKDLHNELSQLAETSTHNALREGADLPLLPSLDAVEECRRDLEALESTTAYGRFITHSPSILPAYSDRMEEAVSARLTAHLARLQLSSAPPHTPESGSEEHTPAQTGAVAQYELFVSPAHLKHRAGIDHSALEARVSQLERVLGPKLSDGVAGDSGGRGLIHMVDDVRTALSTLEDGELSALERRVDMLDAQLTDVLKREEEVLGTKKLAKVTEMYDTMHRLDMSIQQLPVVVERLHALKAVQEESASICDTVKRLHTQQHEITKALQDGTANMELLEAGFKRVAEQIAQNKRVLEEKMARIGA